MPEADSVRVRDLVLWLDLLAESVLPAVSDTLLLLPVLNPTCTIRLAPALNPIDFPWDFVRLWVMAMPWEIPSDTPSVLASDRERVSLSLRVRELPANVESCV